MKGTLSVLPGGNSIGGWLSRLHCEPINIINRHWKRAVSEGACVCAGVCGYWSMAGGVSVADGGVVNEDIVSLLWWTATWFTAVVRHQWVTALWPAWARLKICSWVPTSLSRARRFISITTLCMDPGESHTLDSGDKLKMTRGFWYWTSVRFYVVCDDLCFVVIDLRCFNKSQTESRETA